MSRHSQGGHRVAIIADIHGNMPALEAVIADIDRQAPDEVLVGGDLVGRGPQGSAVVREIRRRGWTAIRGNHEEYLSSFRKGDIPADWLHLDEWSAARWMAAELSDTDAEYIDSLPFSTGSAVAPGLLLTHGSPRSTSDGLGPWTRDSKLHELLEPIDETVLACGHTHRPMIRKTGSGLVVNVGSVGLPFNGDRRAQYAELSLEGGGWRASHRQVEYEIEDILAVYRDSGFLEAGGITAELLRLELLHAAPYLVPFLRWAEALGATPDAGSLQAFLDFYEPDEPLSDFFLRIRSIKTNRESSPGGPGAGNC